MHRNVKGNSKKLLPIIEMMHLCDHQNIPLRGHIDDAANVDDGDPCNFQALLAHRIQAGDAVLQDHFINAPRNATYRSKTIQNDLIGCCREILTKKISDEVRKAKFFQF